MKQLGIAALLTALAFAPAWAEGTCAGQAVGKDGRPLAGAARTSFMNKCTREACEPKAIDKNGKPLAGAAKTSFMQKCQRDS